MTQETDTVELVAALMGTDDQYSQMVNELHEYSLGVDGGRCHEISVECGTGVEQMTVGRALSNMALLYP